MTSTRSTGREYDNNFKDYRGENLLTDEGKLGEKYSGEIRNTITKYLQKLHTGLERETDQLDYTVYTGSSGIALLYLHLFETLGASGDKRYLEQALSYIKEPLRRLRGKRFTFLCGDSGPLAIGAILYDLLGQKDQSKECVQRLETLHVPVCSDTSLPDELLYGRVGYLYSLLFVRSRLGVSKIDNSIIIKVFKTVIESGRALAQEQNWKHPLMYAWHEKHYLGAAHGLAGIFYIMMQVPDPAVRKYLEELVKPSLDYCLTLQYPSGNFPSSINSNSIDKLVHWCHGAPGWIHTLVQAYKLYKDELYLDAAKHCAEVIWNRGLLKKGDGLCHGTSGNGYAFLLMYRFTGEHRYLYRAYRFAEWCLVSVKDPPANIPDTPYSLFEGLAGTIYYLIDVLDPTKANFPGFQLNEPSWISKSLSGTKILSQEKQ